MKMPPAKPARRYRRTLHVEQEATVMDGKIRRHETVVATEEHPDGTTEAIERESKMESTEQSPWFSVGTVRTRTKTTKPG